MTTVTAYQTPQQYLDATEQTLERKEVENNLILGLCHGFADKAKPQPNCFFISAVEDGAIRATSIKTWTKAIVSGFAEDTRHLKPLADYYLNEGIDLQGVFGESPYAAAFSAYYGKKTMEERGLLVHRLVSVNDLPLAPGHFETAGYRDMDTLIQWTLDFEAEAEVHPKHSAALAKAAPEAKLIAGSIYKWTDKGEMVSLAAIVRKTRNTGVVGLVYTPPERRGKGYATSCVQLLSARMLQSGLKSCALFTDKANPTSNHIYRKIGYEPLTEFLDVDFSGA